MAALKYHLKEAVKFLPFCFFVLLASLKNATGRLFIFSKTPAWVVETVADMDIDSPRLTNLTKNFIRQAREEMTLRNRVKE